MKSHFFLWIASDSPEMCINLYWNVAQCQFIIFSFFFSSLALLSWKLWMMRVSCLYWMCGGSLLRWDDSHCCYHQYSYSWRKSYWQRWRGQSKHCWNCQNCSNKILDFLETWTENQQRDRCSMCVYKQHFGVCYCAVEASWQGSGNSLSEDVLKRSQVFFFRFFFLNEENWLLQPQVRPHSRRDVFVGGYTVNWDAAWRHVRMPKLLYVRMKWLNTVVYARKIAGKKWEGQYFVWKKNRRLFDGSNILDLSSWHLADAWTKYSCSIGVRSWSKCRP